MDIYVRHKDCKYPHIGEFSLTLQSITHLIVLAGAILLAGVSAAAQTPVARAWSVLKSGLADKNVDKRAAATGVLGLLENNSEALKLLLVALEDERPEVRAEAAKALGSINAKSAAPKLAKTVRGEKDVQVVIAGARSLVALGNPLGYSVYYAVLTGERKSGGGLLDDQRKMLKDPKKMAQFGFEQGIGFVPFAGIGYGAIKALRKDDTSPVRAAAAKVLANDPDPKTLAALVEASSDPSWIVRAAALDALSQRGDPSVLIQVEPRLDDQNDAVRYTAAGTVIHLNDLGAGKTRRQKR
jgi:HEAT repeat protein